MTIYAFDTNTVIHLLNHNELLIAKINEAVSTGARFIIPPVVDYEIQRGLLYKYAPKKESMYSAFRSHYGVGDMTSEMWARAAHIYVALRHRGFTVADDDIFIAAFCLVNNYILVTGNTKDFENILDIQLVNWTNK